MNYHKLSLKLKRFCGAHLHKCIHNLITLFKRYKKVTKRDEKATIRRKSLEKEFERILRCVINLIRCDKRSFSELMLWQAGDSCATGSLLKNFIELFAEIRRLPD